MPSSKVRQDPILIAAPPRSGTTLVTGLLGKHGVWIGKGGTTKWPGTNPDYVSENAELKKLLINEGKRYGYKNWGATLPTVEYNKELKNAIEGVVPLNKRWLLKTGWTLILADFWLQAYPQARWVLPDRSTQAIFDSMQRHPSMRKHPDDVKLAYIKALKVCQEEVVERAYHSLFVDVNAISQTKEGELIKLFGFVEIAMDYNIVTQWIQPQIMH